MREKHPIETLIETAEASVVIGRNSVGNQSIFDALAVACCAGRGWMGTEKTRAQDELRKIYEIIFSCDGKTAETIQAIVGPLLLRHIEELGK